MSRLAQALRDKKFVVTTELNPPKGTDLGPLLKKADTLKDKVVAFNLTDSHTSRMSMAPLAVARLLLDRGAEPILQLTCRDRNRIAIQADLLGASALGVSNLLCMTGDHPSGGDHPDAKAVFDLEAIGLLRAIQSLQSGVDIGGSELRGRPSFYAGAVVNPGASDLDKELGRMEQKIEAGAAFFQTQAVYEPGAFERFMARAAGFKVAVLAGHIMLKSANMARSLNANVPGVSVPDAIVRELEGAEDRREASVEIVARIIREIRPMCQGVHIMAIGWESRIPQVLEASAIT